MIKMAIYFFVVFFCMIRAEITIGDDTVTTVLSSIESKNIEIVYAWKTDDLLMCTVTRPTDTHDSILEIYKKDDAIYNKIYSTSPGPLPHSIIDFGGRLVVVWGTATGFIVNIYEYKNNSIIKLIDDGSNLMPELVYLGAELKPAVIIPKLEWTKGGEGAISVKKAVFANVYILETKTITSHYKVFWDKRYLVDKNN